jgi:hypothetical protein
MSQPWGKLGPHFVSLESLQRSYCLEAPASKAPGLSGAVMKVFREVGRGRRQGVLSLAVLSLGLMGCAAKAQMVIIFPGGVGAATAHITLENPLVGGSFHLILGQRGWAC